MTKIEQAVGFDREEYEAMKRTAIEEGAQIVHIRSYGRTGGATVVWRRSTGRLRDGMVELSVAWCKPDEVFCRRIGSFLALSNMLEERTIMLPIGSEDNAVIVSRIRAVFGVML